MGRTEPLFPWYLAWAKRKPDIACPGNLSQPVCDYSSVDVGGRTLGVERESQSRARKGLTNGTNRSHHIGLINLQLTKVATMLYRRIALFALFLAATVQTTVAQQKPEATPVDGKIKWVYDYEEGKRLSQSQGKPMFVVFRCER